MADIKYVCLSDMHFGEEDSLLTNMKTASNETDPSEPSPVLLRLVECLKALIKENKSPARPTLILNGDILELALALTNQAAMAFERFMELIRMPDRKPLFDQIVYIPGNHDHHIWEIARETLYVETIKGLKKGAHLEPLRHATQPFSISQNNLIPSYFLNNLIQRYPHLKNMEVQIAYPNFGLCAADGHRCALFHHGHFVEGMYQLMSKFRSILFDQEMPATIEGIESENFAWIDFFWSAMGRSGAPGESIESIYEHMLHPKHLRLMLSKFAKNLAEEYDLPGWGDWMEAKLLEKIFHHLADKIANRERKYTNRPLSQSTEEGLWTYVEVPLKGEILTEFEGKMPAEVSFVFGHTHKPFQEDLQFKGYPAWVDVYNTGGWVVDTVQREPLHGAAVVLADENLNLTSLRMYNEAHEPGEYQVSVKVATHAGEKENPFHERISKLVENKAKVFEDFSTSVERAIYIRAQKLRSRLMGYAS